MGLSESEIEARLALLRRQREALDREIADLVLYLELGRRLGAAGTGAAAASEPVIAPPPGQDAPVGRGVPPPASPADRVVSADPVRVPSALQSKPQLRPRSGLDSDDPAAGTARPPAIPFTEDAAGARRYGRALVEAARTAIAEAGRPLHAAEILAVLAGQGFTVPGRDPVAALNTRLWKRAGPDGPLRRVGEATYALATPV